MEKIKVSVIIPIYNASKYLPDCLNAILSQTLKEIEIICVNDGSTDNSLQILEAFAEKDNRIIVINQENKGAGSARNAGLAIANGAYLSFLDADDFYESDMLECSFNLAAKENADVCVFYADLFDDITKSYRACTWAFRRQYFSDQTVFNPKKYPNNENIFRMFNGWPWDKLFKREFIQKNALLFQNLRTTNDMYFVLMALAKAERIITLDKCLIHQRVNVKTSLSRTREKSWNCFYLGLQAMQNELLASNDYATYQKAFVNWALEFSLWHLNTMKGTAYCNAYKLLRDVAFAEFRVTETPEEDFYNQKQFSQYKEIMENDIETALLNKVSTLENELEQLKSEKEKLSASLNVHNSNISKPKKLRLYQLCKSILKHFIKRKGR